MPQLRVLVADDSRAFRTVLARSIDASTIARVVAHASDGQDALEKAAEYRPDVATLDIDMPRLNGLEALDALKRQYPRLAVVMVSALTRGGAETTVRALAQGAFDFVTKPDGTDPQANEELLRNRMLAILSSLLPVPASPPPRATPRPAKWSVPWIVAIGSSTGGPNALQQVLSRLPAAFPAPIVVAQHMPALFTSALAKSLGEKSAVRVVEAQSGARLEGGTVYIAPGGKHLRVTAAGAAERRTELTEDPPENYCRPAVDYLFRSVAEVYRDRALGVILTGMGRDGTAGLRAMKQHGVKVIGQSAASCTVYVAFKPAAAAAYKATLSVADSGASSPQTVALSGTGS